VFGNRHIIQSGLRTLKQIQTTAFFAALQAAGNGCSYRMFIWMRCKLRHRRRRDFLIHGLCNWLGTFRHQKQITYLWIPLSDGAGSIDFALFESCSRLG